MYDKIQSSDFIGIYRITNGTLLYVQKYGVIPNHDGYSSGSEFNKNTKIIRGCKGLRQLVVDYNYKSFDQTPKLIPAGTFIINGQPVQIVDLENYTFEVKSNEGLKGSKFDMLGYLKLINEVIDSYK